MANYASYGNPVVNLGTKPSSNQLVGVGSTAVPLGSGQCSGVLIQNDPGSSGNLYIGTQTLQPLQIIAGQFITIPCSDISQVYVKSASSSTVNFMYMS
jgi:hypothetical protein